MVTEPNRDLERDIFAEKILRAIDNKIERLSDKERKQELTGFLAMQGHEYKNKKQLMVVGRATNGWMTEAEGWIRPEQLKESRSRMEYARKVYEKANGKGLVADGECPMKWVADSWRKPWKRGNYTTSGS